MKRYAVRITKAAQNDIYQVIDHISNVYKVVLIKTVISGALIKR